MKKKVYIFIIVLTFIILSILDYGREYMIEDDLNHISTSILSYINRPVVKYKDLDVKDVLEIDNKKYVLFTLDDSLGFSVLIRGYNNKYKYYSASYGGSGSFGGNVYKTNKGKYIVIYGKNQELKYKSVTVSLENKNYKIALSQNEYYLVYCSVPSKTKSSFIENHKFEISKNQVGTHLKLVFYKKRIII